MQEYIWTSAGSSSDKPDRSWYGDFAYWVLKMAGVMPLPPVASCGKTGWNTVARFCETYKKRTPNTYIAKAGDMHYVPNVRGHDGGLHETHHVGFVMEDSGGSNFCLIIRKRERWRKLGDYDCRQNWRRGCQLRKTRKISRQVFY